jgi:hypothetical protein
MNRGAPTPDTVTLHVPFRIVKRGGRKEMQLPDGTTQPRQTDNTLIKALARAFRWKRMLESGEFATIAELEPPRFSRRVKLSKDTCYEQETLHPELPCRAA